MRLHACPGHLSCKHYPTDRERDVQRGEEFKGAGKTGTDFIVPFAESLETEGGPAGTHDFHDVGVAFEILGRIGGGAEDLGV